MADDITPEVPESRGPVPVFIIDELFAMNGAEAAGFKDAVQFRDEISEVQEKLVIVPIVSHVPVAV